MSESTINPGLYRHYKGGLYRVHRIAYDHENQEPLVIYEMLYDSPDFPNGTWWVRPLSMFTEQVTLEDGSEVLRFVILEA